MGNLIKEKPYIIKTITVYDDQEEIYIDRVIADYSYLLNVNCIDHNIDYKFLITSNMDIKSQSSYSMKCKISCNLEIKENGDLYLIHYKRVLFKEPVTYKIYVKKQ